MQNLLKHLQEMDMEDESHAPTIDVPLHSSYYEIGAAACTLFASLGICLIAVTPMITIQTIALVAYLAIINTVLGAFAGVYLAARWCIWRYPVWQRASAKQERSTTTFAAESHLFSWSLQRSEAFGMISL